MDDLNAQQIVLLTLLVSFVTSIATGIVTVSLLEQAPDPVTQTINRVVERTIETVVTEEEDNEPGERVVETVVVKEEDAVVDVVDKNSKSVVRIYRNSGDKKGDFVGLGFVINNSGRVLTSNNSLTFGRSYIGVYSNGEFKLNSTEVEGNNLLAFLDPTDVGETTFSKTTLSNSQTQLGQTVVLLSGRETNKVSTGIITEFVEKTTEEGSLDRTGIITSINPNNVLRGSFITNLKGEIVGVNLVTNLTGAEVFVPSSNLTPFVGE